MGSQSGLPRMDQGLRVIAMEYCHEMPRQRERERGARPPVCQYCAAIADTSGPGLPLGWTIQSGSPRVDLPLRHLHPVQPALDGVAAVRAGRPRVRHRQLRDTLKVILNLS